MAGPQVKEKIRKTGEETDNVLLIRLVIVSSDNKKIKKSGNFYLCFKFVF
jgi:hypothetical protein